MSTRWGGPSSLEGAKQNADEAADLSAERERVFTPGREGGKNDHRILLIVMGIGAQHLSKAPNT